MIPILNTKLHIPRLRPDSIPRPTLVKRFEQAFQRRLTLLSAQAGSGKTTLLAAWVESCSLRRTRLHPGGSAVSPNLQPSDNQTDGAFAWISLDEGDNDPLRFFAYLIPALQTLHPGLGSSVQALLESPQAALLMDEPLSQSNSPVEAILTPLLNEMDALGGDFVLILDDYLHISNPVLHNALLFLIEHHPPSMHLVIATRTDPPLPLPRLRARGEIFEIRAADLRFSPSEAALYLNRVSGLSLSEQETAALTERTEGWAAGLQLAALALHRLIGDEKQEDPLEPRVSSFIQQLTGSNQFILDYLFEEVLDHQPGPVQNFLMQTSVLDRMCAELCGAVVETGEWSFVPGSQSPSPDPASQPVLEFLERSNLFIIPLDSERRWYRYHHLFAGLLRHRLQRFQPAQIPGLHRRAAGWLEQYGYLDEALEHWMQAGDIEGAVRLVETHALHLLEQGQLTRVLGWMGRLSDPVILSRPWLSVYHAWALLLTGQTGRVETRLQPAEAAGIDLESGPQPGCQPLLGYIAAIRAYLKAMSGDLQNSVNLAQQALEHLPEEALSIRSIVAFTSGGVQIMVGDIHGAEQAFAQAGQMGRASGNLHLAIPAVSGLASLQASQGKLLQAEVTYREAIQLAQAPEGQPLPVAAGALTGLGELFYEWNDLAGAAQYLAQGVDLSRSWGNPDTRVSALAALARFQFAAGSPEKAEELFQEANGIARSHTLTPPAASGLASARLEQFIRRGDLLAAETLVEERDLQLHAELLFWNQGEYLGLARLLLAGGRQEQGERLLARLLAVQGGGRVGEQIAALGLQALNLQSQGQEDEALAALLEALSLGLPGGYLRTFLDEGEPLAQLVGQFEKSVEIGSLRLKSYAQKLLAAFLENETPGPVHSPRSNLNPPPHELSGREMEVLRLIAEGLTNQAIAGRLVISLGTVKAHTYSIYQKLGVGSRTQAVAQARSLGLLP